jgi:hypothetical protein
MDEAKDSAEGTIRPTAGMHVKSRFNEGWGEGMVYATQGTSVRVLFANHPDKKPVLVPMKSLTVVRAGKWAEAATKAQEREDKAATKTKTTARKGPTVAAAKAADEAEAAASAARQAAAEAEDAAPAAVADADAEPAKP